MHWISHLTDAVREDRTWTNIEKRLTNLASELLNQQAQEKLVNFNDEKLL
jgi:hypothetical protein